MDVEEAFKRLGLTSAATREEINAAYRQKSRAVHPDVTGGTSERQAELGEAREIALDHIPAEGRELTVWREKLPALEQAVNAMLFQQQAEGIKKSIKRKRSSRLISMKNASAWIGLLIACATALVQFNPMGNVLELVSPEAKYYVVLVSGLLAIMFGIAFAFLKFRIEHLSARIDDYNDSLSSSNTCAHELSALIKYDEKYADRKLLDLQEIIDSDERARQHRLFVTSPFDLTVSEKAPLIFKKAQEHKLIRKVEPSDSAQQFRDEYEVLSLSPLRPS